MLDARYHAVGRFPACRPRVQAKLATETTRNRETETERERGRQRESERPSERESVREGEREERKKNRRNDNNRDAGFSCLVRCPGSGYGGGLALTAALLDAGVTERGRPKLAGRRGNDYLAASPSRRTSPCDATATWNRDSHCCDGGREGAGATETPAESSGTRSGRPRRCEGCRIEWGPLRRGAREGDGGKGLESGTGENGKGRRSWMKEEDSEFTGWRKK